MGSGSASLAGPAGISLSFFNVPCSDISAHKIWSPLIGPSVANKPVAYCWFSACACARVLPSLRSSWSCGLVLCDLSCLSALQVCAGGSSRSDPSSLLESVLLLGVVAGADRLEDADLLLGDVGEGSDDDALLEDESRGDGISIGSGKLKSNYPLTVSIGC